MFPWTLQYSGNVDVATTNVAVMLVTSGSLSRLSALHCVADAACAARAPVSAAMNTHAVKPATLAILVMGLPL